MCRPFFVPVVEDVEFRSGKLDLTVTVDDLAVIEFSGIKFGKIPEHTQRHIGIPRALVLHQDDVAVANPEADVVLDVVIEHTAQCRDPDVFRMDGLPCQSLVETGKTLLVIEDASKE